MRLQDLRDLGAARSLDCAGRVPAGERAHCSFAAARSEDWADRPWAIDAAGPAADVALLTPTRPVPPHRCASESATPPPRRYSESERRASQTATLLHQAGELLATGTGRFQLQNLQSAAGLFATALRQDGARPGTEHGVAWCRAVLLVDAGTSVSLQ